MRGKGKWIRREELEDVHRGRIGRKCYEKRRGIGWDGMDPVKWTFPLPSLKRTNCAKAMSESNQSKKKERTSITQKGPNGNLAIEEKKWPCRKETMEMEKSWFGDEGRDEYIVEV
jgi:hypothetical protein